MLPEMSKDFNYQITNYFTSVYRGEEWRNGRLRSAEKQTIETVFIFPLNSLLKI